MSHPPGREVRDAGGRPVGAATGSVAAARETDHPPPVRGPHDPGVGEVGRSAAAAAGLAELDQCTRRLGDAARRAATRNGEWHATSLERVLRGDDPR
ncbi:MAG: hypothetical protein JWO38_5078 [Gemmataceae bacterium]|nr:hypothetical protein [Gemmataceae bacterium]